MSASRTRECFLNDQVLQEDEMIAAHHTIFSDGFYAQEFMPYIKRQIHEKDFGLDFSLSEFLSFEKYSFNKLLPAGFYSPLVVVRIYCQLYDCQKLPWLSDNQCNILKAENAVWKALYAYHKPRDASHATGSFTI